MGGYSTSLYLGLALGSFTLGPVITRYGYVPGFAIGGATGVLGTLVAALLWAAGRVPAPGQPSRDEPATCGSRRPGPARLHRGEPTHG
jgi:MFS family permease